MRIIFLSKKVKFRLIYFFLSSLVVGFYVCAYMIYLFLVVFDIEFGRKEGLMGIMGSEGISSPWAASNKTFFFS